MQTVLPPPLTGGLNNNNTALGNVGNLTIDGGSLNLSDSAVARVNGLTLKNNASVSVQNGTSLSYRLGGNYADYNYVTVTALNAGQDAVVSGNATGIFSNTAANDTVSHAQVTLNNIGKNFASSAALYTDVAVTAGTSVDGAFSTITFSRSGSTFVTLNAPGKGLTVSDGAASTSTLKTVSATGGDVTVCQMGTGVQVESLTLSNGKNINFYSSADGMNYIRVAPEPATATLSLPALAALCTRRKRR